MSELMNLLYKMMCLINILDSNATIILQELLQAIIKIMSTPLILFNSKKHELNYEGCRCLLCLKINMNQNCQISTERYNDKQSSGQHLSHQKEAYLGMIDQFIVWQRFPRKIRFCLPEICVFLNSNPEYLVAKNKDIAPIKIIRKKSKVNMFQIKNFFLEGFLLHHPQVVNKKKEKDTYKQKSKHQCIVAAKYVKNQTQLLTYDQIQSLFKSKFKFMKDGLIYLQTLVGAHHAQQISVKINLNEIELQEKDLFQRAKQEVKIIVQETKITDHEYHSEKVQIEFEKNLKNQHFKKYLLYQSLKMILLSSKLNSKIIKHCIFKWTYVNLNLFLWDIRIQQQVASSEYWQNSVTHALEIKLKKTMSMMEFQSDGQKESFDKDLLSTKAQEFSRWLERSTSQEWSQMAAIKTRLEKLEIQKKALLQSQKQGHDGINKSFRLRNVRRKQSMNISFNPQS